jgi:hypothetical protein
MSHLFVESNWLFAYAAPAHHHVEAAAKILERARLGEFTIHLPNACIGEARQAILSKCQPRREAEAIRKFLKWSEPAGKVTKEAATAARVVLDKYESSLQRDLQELDARLRELSKFPYVKTFGLDDEMLEFATELALDRIAAKPVDHAILAGVLVSASRLWTAGERRISFCETDGDLQPWDKLGRPSQPLFGVYERAHVWVHTDFSLAVPPRPAGFE